MKKYLEHIITNDLIHIICDEGAPISIPKSDGRYEELSNLLETEQFDRVPHLIDRGAQINDYTKGHFRVIDGVVHIDDEKLPNGLSDKLLEFIDNGQDTRPLELFWYNLRKNPSKDSRKDLFDFLRANKIPLTINGHFIAYKKVRKDFTDCHTGKFNNRPGRVVKMHRSEVDHNRNHTCSAGLHVAAFEYANNFNSGNLLEVEVNPKDVVAVPPDYNQQKMRVCKYRVIGLATQELSDLLYKAEQPSEKAVSSQLCDCPFKVLAVRGCQCGGV